MPDDVRRRRYADIGFLLFELGINITQNKEIMSLSSPQLGKWQVSYEPDDAVMRFVRWEDSKISLQRDVLLTSNQGWPLLEETEELEEYILKHIWRFIMQEDNDLRQGVDF